MRFKLRLLRILGALMICIILYFGFTKIQEYYHEQRVFKQLTGLEKAMQEYRRKTIFFPSQGLLWANTDSVNFHLKTNIKDNVFNYQCLGFAGWASFRCEAKSPLYNWKLHAHEGKPVHCASSQPHGPIDDSCPSCASYPKSRVKCR